MKYEDLLTALSSQGFLIIDKVPYTQCHYCGKNIELFINDFNDPDGEFSAECKDCDFHIEYHEKDPWYFKKHMGFKTERET